MRTQNETKWNVGTACKDDWQIETKIPLNDYSLIKKERKKKKQLNSLWTNGMIR